MVSPVLSLSSPTAAVDVLLPLRRYAPSRESTLPVAFGADKADAAPADAAASAAEKAQATANAAATKAYADEIKTVADEAKAIAEQAKSALASAASKDEFDALSTKVDGLNSDLTQKIGSINSKTKLD